MPTYDKVRSHLHSSCSDVVAVETAKSSVVQFVEMPNPQSMKGAASNKGKSFPKADKGKAQNKGMRTTYKGQEPKEPNDYQYLTLHIQKGGQNSDHPHLRNFHIPDGIMIITSLSRLSWCR